MSCMHNWQQDESAKQGWVTNVIRKLPVQRWILHLYSIMSDKYYSHTVQQKYFLEEFRVYGLFVPKHSRFLLNKCSNQTQWAVYEYSNYPVQQFSNRIVLYCTISIISIEITFYSRLTEVSCSIIELKLDLTNVCCCYWVPGILGTVLLRLMKRSLSNNLW